MVNSPTNLAGGVVQDLQIGMAQNSGMDRSAGDPDVWIGLDHLRFGMDHGVWIACGTGVWIGTLDFEPQPIFNEDITGQNAILIHLAVIQGYM